MGLINQQQRNLGRLCKPSGPDRLWLSRGDTGAAGCAETFDVVWLLCRTGSGIEVELSLGMRNIIHLPVKGWGRPRPET